MNIKIAIWKVYYFHFYGFFRIPLYNRQEEVSRQEQELLMTTIHLLRETRQDPQQGCVNYWIE